MKIFVETTIPSYLVSRPARDLVQMARQQTTRDWWETCRGYHELFTSQIVLDEAGQARLRRLASSEGYELPAICTPEELMDIDPMKTTSISPKATLSDEVLREVWRIKDELSASYNHDLERLFLDAQERQRLSGRKSVNIQKGEAGWIKGHA